MQIPVMELCSKMFYGIGKYILFKNITCLYWLNLKVFVHMHNIFKIFCNHPQIAQGKIPSTLLDKQFGECDITAL